MWRGNDRGVCRVVLVECVGKKSLCVLGGVSSGCACVRRVSQYVALA